jgi:S-adenosylmethionine:tRNA ribosyltransferase-isomerase
VDHLEPEETAARLAAHAQALAGSPRRLLRGIEVEEAQHEVAGVVVQGHGELPARPELNLRLAHRALDLRRLAVGEGGDGHDLRLVLEAQRQVQREVDVAGEAERREGFADPRVTGRLRAGAARPGLGLARRPGRRRSRGGGWHQAENSAPAMKLDDFDYALPPELVAQHPAAERSASRLLDATVEPPADRTFRDLASLLAAGDLLVVNDTRVVKARLAGRKASGGGVEALVERVEADGTTVLAHLRASKSPKAGTSVVFADGAFEARVLGRAGADGSLFALAFPGDAFALLEAHGRVPLPPYIARTDAADADDARRYQTVFARDPGAVAAPTAALHFDEPLLAALAERGVERASVTLHVGAGTFQPMRSAVVAEHVMHRERFTVPQATVDAATRTRERGGRVVAVGTTTLRALESAARGGRLEAASGETDLFVVPGFEFRVVDRLVTNFHLPKSTLLLLVSAFAGRARIRALYAHAIRERYRFFSYGDAMLLARADGVRPPAGAPG